MADRIIKYGEITRHRARKRPEIVYNPKPTEKRQKEFSNLWDALCRGKRYDKN